MNEWRQRDTARLGCVNRLRGQRLPFAAGLFTTKSRRADACTSRMAENYANSSVGIRSTRCGRSCGSQRLGHRASMRDSKRSVPTGAKLRNLHASVTLKLLGSLFRVLLFSCCFVELSLATQLAEEGHGFVAVNNSREDLCCVLYSFVMGRYVSAFWKYSYCSLRF